MKRILLIAFVALSLMFSMVSCDEPDDSGLGDNAIGGEGDLSGGSDNPDVSENSGNSGEGEENSDSGNGVTFIHSKNSKKYHISTCRFVVSMSEETKQVLSGTAAELNAEGYSPCMTCKPDPDYDYDAADEGNEDNEDDIDYGYAYVLNSNSKKFHLPSCRSAKNMNEENKLYSNDTRDSIVNQGYEPCGTCKP